MREAIGNTFLYNVVIVFIFIALLVLVGSLSYSKGFKAKNRIIDIIEKNRGYNDEVADEINEILRSSGYRPKAVFRHQDCPEVPDDQADTKALLAEGDRYMYCVYSNTTERGLYYSVIVYIRFEIPLISGLLEFPVHGDTKTIYDLNI